MGLLFARPASATEWIFCSDADTTIKIGLLLGQADAIYIAAATLRYGGATYTTNSVYGEGELVLVRAIPAGARNLRVDITAARDGKPLGDIQLRQVTQGKTSSYLGELTLTDKGRWSLSCDGE